MEIGKEGESKEHENKVAKANTDAFGLFSVLPVDVDKKWMLRAVKVGLQFR